MRDFWGDSIVNYQKLPIIANFDQNCQKWPKVTNYCKKCTKVY